MINKYQLLMANGARLPEILRLHRAELTELLADHLVKNPCAGTAELVALLRGEAT